jgi:hypothetical protein
MKFAIAMLISIFGAQGCVAQVGIPDPPPDPPAKKEPALEKPAAAPEPQISPAEDEEPGQYPRPWADQSEANSFR